MTDEEKSYFGMLSLKRAKIADVIFDEPSVQGVKTSIVDKYSDQAHFVYELIQNADDAGATDATFDVYEDKLTFSHNGTRHFHVSNPATEGEDFAAHRVGDVNAITGIGFSSKLDSNKKGNAIGKFGMGFKSIFQYTTTPEIYDPNISFRIERQIVPSLIEHDYPGRQADETLFVFPFNNQDAKSPVVDSLERLKSLLFPTLFLRHLEIITFNYGEDIGEYRKQIVSSQSFINEDTVTICEWIKHSKTIQSECIDENMLLFSRTDRENHRYSIGFMLGKDGKPIPSDYKAFCFFPTKHETKLRFLIHAPFLLTDSREGIKEGEGHNKDMVNKLSDLMYDGLLYMRDMRTSEGDRLIDDKILDVIPIRVQDDNENNLLFYSYIKKPISFFDSFWEKALTCFRTEQILPTRDGYTRKACAYWPTTNQITLLFPDEKLQALYGNTDISWVFQSRWKDQSRDKSTVSFIRECISETPSDTALLDRISPEFIEVQPIEWLSRLYKWLDESEERRNKAKRLPIFLNAQGKAVAAFDQKGDHILFLPATGSDNYETINADLLTDSNAKELVKRYEIATPSEDDRIRFIIEDKLPICESEESDNLFVQVVEYYARLPQDDKEKLTSELKGKVRLRCCNLLTRETQYKNTLDDVLYENSDFIKAYFEGVENVYVIDIDYYKSRIPENCWADLEKMLPDIGVWSMPIVLQREFNVSEWDSKVKKRYPQCVPYYKGAECHYWEQKFIIKFLHGASELIARIKEQDIGGKKKQSSMLWKALKVHSQSYDSFLEGEHYYFYRGKCREKFDSPQLFDLRNNPWIVLDDGTCKCPCQIPINKLPQEYKRDSDDCDLVRVLEFLPPEVTKAQLDAETAEIEDQAYNNLSEAQKAVYDLGRRMQECGVRKEDVDEFFEWKKRKDENRKLGDERLEKESSVFLPSTDSSPSENTVRVNPFSSNGEVQGNAESLTTNVGIDEHSDGSDGRVVSVNAHRRSFPNSVIGRIEQKIDAYKESIKKNSSPPPLPDPDESIEEDDDEFTPKSVDFERKIKEREARQAREIAALEHGEELQQAAQQAERYSLGWFKSMLDLEMLGKEDDAASQREISICFTKMEHERGTERTFVLKRPSRNIPQWIEDLSGIPLELRIADKIVRPVIEVMSVQSFNLRVKLKADSKLEGLNLLGLLEAKIVVQRPTFLIDELRKGLSSLPFDDTKNLRDDLTENMEFIFGPPGTGKTTFLSVERIIPLMRGNQNYKVIVLAPTNKAADVLTSRIISKMGNDTSYRRWLIRFGSTLDERLEETGVCVGKDVDLKKYPRHVMITTIARFPYDSCITGNSEPIRISSQQWDYVIVDEASMIPLVNIIYPLYQQTQAQFIVAGDPFQIEPIISNEYWKDENIYTIVGLNNFVSPQTEPHSYPVVKLTTQYRSVPSVGKIFSRYRYGGILAHYRSESSHRPLDVDGMPSFAPLTMVKFPVSRYESIYRLKRLGPNGGCGSSYQIYSALFAHELVCAIARRMKQQKERFRIGVISPYRAQADLVQRLVESAKLPEYVQVAAGTVHGFQGDECEMIVALFNPPPGISAAKGSFINKKNIINVAASRARDYLVVLMPDDDTLNLGNMVEVRKIEALMRQDLEHFVQYNSAEFEQAIFGSSKYIEENAFSTGHQSVNVYGNLEMRYEIRTEDTAVDIQIHEDA